MTALDVPRREDVVGSEALPPPPPAPDRGPEPDASTQSRFGVVALISAAVVGFWLGRLVFGGRCKTI